MKTGAAVNPIIPGFAPDPSLVLVDGTYYLVTSTFHLFPGLPIYTSQDLVHWNHIGTSSTLLTALLDVT
jgi:beta-xylosidase